MRVYQCELYARKSLEFLGFIEYWHASMHRLHPKHLVVALFIIKHGGCEVIEHIFCCERSICLNPLMPDEKSVTVVVCGV